MGFQRTKAILGLLDDVHAPVLKSGDMLVLLLLGHREFDGNGSCIVSYETLLNWAHIAKEDNLRGHLKRLKGLGLVDWKSGGLTKDGRRANSYSLHVDEKSLAKLAWYRPDRPDPIAESAASLAAAKPDAAEARPAVCERDDPADSIPEKDRVSWKRKQNALGYLADRLTRHYGAVDSPVNRARLTDLLDKMLSKTDSDSLFENVAVLLQEKVFSDKIKDPMRLVLSKIRNFVRVKWGEAGQSLFKEMLDSIEERHG